jgi:hypothetical protein
MERYPMLRLITRFNKAILVLVALAAVILVAWHAVDGASFSALVLLTLAGGLTIAAVKVFLELVTLVTEMLVPR